MPEPVLHSPLAEVLAQGKRVLQIDGRVAALGERAFLDMLVLRGDAADARFAAAVLAHTGLALPQRPNTAALAPERQLLWLGPDEWLYKGAGGSGAALAGALRDALQGVHHAVVEVGHGSTTFTLQGPAAGELLARGCPLDFHPRVFGSGAVAQSHLAKAAVTVLCLEAGTHFELTVRRSFADYLFRWLCAASD